MVFLQMSSNSRRACGLKEISRIGLGLVRSGERRKVFLIGIWHAVTLFPRIACGQVWTCAKLYAVCKSLYLHFHLCVQLYNCAFIYAPHKETVTEYRDFRDIPLLTVSAYYTSRSFVYSHIPKGNFYFVCCRPSSQVHYIVSASIITLQVSSFSRKNIAFF